MASANLISRVEKLLRLAAPSSGAPETERTVAALEAAKLVDEHRLAVTERPPPTPRISAPPVPRPIPRQKRSPAWTPPSWSPPGPRSDWGWAYVELRGVKCVVCGKEVHGEAWYDETQGYRHYDITCDEVNT